MNDILESNKDGIALLDGEVVNDKVAKVNRRFCDLLKIIEAENKDKIKRKKDPWGEEFDCIYWAIGHTLNGSELRKCDILPDDRLFAEECEAVVECFMEGNTKAPFKEWVGVNFKESKGIHGHGSTNKILEIAHNRFEKEEQVD